MFNPYEHAVKKIAVLWKTEERLSSEERKANEWLIQIKSNDFKLVCGKGDSNTVFFSVNDSKREIGYPEEIIQKLKKCADQKYWLYRIASKDVQFFHSVNELNSFMSSAKTEFTVHGYRENWIKLGAMKKSMIGYSWTPSK